ncbi:MAG: hypothetical protein FMJ08_09390 [Halomonas sp.]|nr:hypothetical protein [Halomonas sp.]TVM05407.1 MAG: hypothetical protein FMJ08_09390 [Halomonas sp.]
MSASKEGVWVARKTRRIALFGVTVGCCLAGVALAQPAAESASMCHAAGANEAVNPQKVVALDRATLAAHEALPWHRLEVDAAQQALGDDPDKLFEWVRDQTRWLPYAGELRGANGVMQDRMGSSLDRALLLAALMENAGHQVRLARSALSQQSLAELEAAWSDMPVARPIEPFQPTSDSAELVGLGEQLGYADGELLADIETAQARAEQASAQLEDDHHRLVQGMQALLDETDSLAARQPSPPALENHWWVQRRQAEEWVDYDPALPDARSGERWLTDAQVSHYFAQELPDEVRHWLTIEVIAEQFDGQQLTENTAFSLTLPASSLAGEQLQLELYPLELPSPQALIDGSMDVESLPERLFTQDKWVPYLRRGEQIERQDGIHADGSLFNPNTDASIAGAAQDASGALQGISVSGGVDQEPAETHLTAVNVRLQLDIPGQSARQIERPIMDLLGPARREADIESFTPDEDQRQQRAIEMLSTLELLPQAYWIPPAQLAAWHYESLMANRQATLAGVHLGAQADTSFIGKALEARSTRRPALDQLATMRLANSPEREHIALGQLNLLGYVTLLEYADGDYQRREGFDILENRVLVASGDQPAQQVRMAQGLLDTLLETRIAVEPGRAMGNTAAAFLEGLKDNHEWQVIDSVSQLDGLDPYWNADIHAHLRNRLAQGERVVMPSSPADPFVWWQLNPKSGDMLGYGPDRRGQFVEGILLLMEAGDNAMSAVGMVQSIWDCLFTSSDPLCCTQDAAAQELITRAVSHGFNGLAEAHDINIIIGRELIKGGTFDRLNSAGIGKAAGDVAGAGSAYIVDNWGRCD